MTLHKLGRLDDARQETHRAIECEAHLGHASEPWRTWNSLAEIEIDAGSPAAAADATRNAITGYLAFRREGGENHDADGRISLAVTRSLLGNDPAKAASLLEHFSATAAASGRLPFIQSLRAVVDGSRDRTLADAPSFFTERAEILLLIETLERASL